MNQFSALPLNVQLRSRSRSLGLKLLLACGLALLMTIPSFFVSSVVEERSQRGVVDLGHIACAVKRGRGASATAFEDQEQL